MGTKLRIWVTCEVKTMDSTYTHPKMRAWPAHYRFNTEEAGVIRAFVTTGNLDKTQENTLVFILRFKKKEGSTLSAVRYGEKRKTIEAVFKVGETKSVKTFATHRLRSDGEW